MSRPLDRPTHRPGLNSAQLRRLTELERAPRLTETDRGLLAVARLYGLPDESDRADRLIDKHEPRRILTAIHDQLAIEGSGDAPDSQ